MHFCTIDKGLYKFYLDWMKGSLFSDGFNLVYRSMKESEKLFHFKELL